MKFVKTQKPNSLKQYEKNKSGNTGRKLSHVIQNLFLFGTQPRVDEHGKAYGSSKDFQEMSQIPRYPQDVFAFVAHLLNISGAFGHYSAAESDPREKVKIELWLDTKDLAGAKAFGESWRTRLFHKHETPPADLASMWSKLISHWDWPINYRVYHNAKTYPEWWAHAYFLMIAADEAALNFGFDSIGETSHFAKQSQTNFFRGGGDKTIGQKNSKKKQYHSIAPTICIAANSDVVCVQPKSLVSSVGSSARVFSQNLALLGPRGTVTAQWSRLGNDDPAAKGLNLLILPIPDNLSSDNFIPRPAKGLTKRASNWRTFEIYQDWLNSGNYAELVEQLILACQTANEEVHGIIFPELALNQKVFSEVAERIQGIPNVEFIIAGASQHCEGKAGNFIWCQSFYGRDVVGDSVSDGVAFVQSKHHRWKLDNGQITRYGLGNLQENYDWWEHINVGGRELNFVTFRSNSIFGALICEDLARSEPCHEILKAVGPNLLFALLMDGPQTAQRWPARYASYLAEDPGTTVLTVTSRGLSKMFDPKCENCTIAHFSDGLNSGSSRIPIESPVMAPASLLKLVPKPNTVTSIDGREKKLEYWTLATSKPLQHLMPTEDGFELKLDTTFQNKLKEMRR